MLRERVQSGLPRHRCRPQPSTKMLVNTEGEGEFVGCACQDIAYLACRCGGGAKASLVAAVVVGTGPNIGTFCIYSSIVGSSHSLSTKHAVLQAELVLRTSTSTHILEPLYLHKTNSKLQKGGNP